MFYPAVIYSKPLRCWTFFNSFQTAVHIKNWSATCVTRSAALQQTKLYFIILCHIVYNMNAKSSTQLKRFFYPMSANCVHPKNDVFFSRFWSWFFFHQIAANLLYNATGVVRFLKAFENMFSGEIDEFFSKNLEFFSKWQKVACIL